MVPAAAAGGAGQQATDRSVAHPRSLRRLSGTPIFVEFASPLAEDPLQDVVCQVLGVSRRVHLRDPGPPAPKRPRSEDQAQFQPLPVPPGFTIPLAKSTQAGQKPEPGSGRASPGHVLGLLQPGLSIDPALHAAALASLARAEATPAALKASVPAEVKLRCKAMMESLSHVFVAIWSNRAYVRLQQRSLLVGCDLRHQR